MSTLITHLAPVLLPPLINALPLPSLLKTPKNIRRIHIAFVSLYIAYTLLSSHLRLSSAGNFYQILGLDRSSFSPERQGEEGVERVLKDGWRAWAKKNHPDRVRDTLFGGREEIEQRFVEGRRAFDGLSDEGKRWAYDRFGEQVMNWKGLVTQREYLFRGLMGSFMFYIVSAGVLAFMTLISNGGPNIIYWRNLTLPTLFLLELSLLIFPTPYAADGDLSSFHPFPNRVLTKLFPSRTQHQHVLFLHELYLALNMCINQLGPLLFPSPVTESRSGGSVEEENSVGKWMDRVESLVGVAEDEASRIYHAELFPVLSTPDETGSVSVDGKLRRLLDREMEDVLVESRIRSHPAVAPAWAEAVRQGRSRKRERIE
ncbi:Molecular chaperone (DnaJ superfamily) [Phaffia rhodozyma]|uniref:Molecular chaperone (DnaJ superfamily) n=1 Tax=Phaffia rhodozyma TaxID=264483 RepID=A0A0F7SVJ2_PHARH|nr:Molecular chaperone (DnaJ superfamily) [Phaffia rhodozyma]